MGEDKRRRIECEEIKQKNDEEYEDKVGYKNNRQTTQQTQDQQTNK